MNKLLTTSALLALLGSSSVFAANLTIPMEFEYLALDGERVETSLFNHKADLFLSPGKHKIAIRYLDVIDDEFTDSQTSIASKPFILSIDVTGDYQYQLRNADGEYVKDPEAFAQKPEILITSKQQSPVNFEVTHTDIKKKDFFTRLTTGGNNEQAQQHIIASTSDNPVVVAPVAVPTGVEAMTAAPSIAAAPLASGDARAQQMLQYWWSQADEKTRKEFMSWAITQL